jgi:hypothetical protein
MIAPPRYSCRPFPPYRHVPGKTPHPTRSTQGHSYGCDLVPVSIGEADWRHSEPFLFAIDLFNHGYYWESHEWLEALWQGSGRGGEIAVFVQGLIQAAAALLKHSMARTDSAARLASFAIAKLRRDGEIVLGVDTRTLAGELADFVAGRRGEPPRIALQFTLPSR